MSTVLSIHAHDFSAVITGRRMQAWMLEILCIQVSTPEQPDRKILKSFNQGSDQPI